MNNDYGMQEIINLIQNRIQRALDNNNLKYKDDDLFRKNIDFEIVRIISHLKNNHDKIDIRLPVIDNDQIREERITLNLKNVERDLNKSEKSLNNYSINDFAYHVGHFDSSSWIPTEIQNFDTLNSRMGNLNSDIYYFRYLKKRELKLKVMLLLDTHFVLVSQ